GLLPVEDPLLLAFDDRRTMVRVDHLVADGKRHDTPGRPGGGTSAEHGHPPCGDESRHRSAGADRERFKFSRCPNDDAATRPACSPSSRTTYGTRCVTRWSH